MEQDDWFDKLIEKIREEMMAQSTERTPDCPSDDELRLLCYEKGEKVPLKQKYISHISLCPYCARYVRNEIHLKIRGKKS